MLGRVSKRQGGKRKAEGGKSRVKQVIFRGKLDEAIVKVSEDQPFITFTGDHDRTFGD